MYLGISVSRYHNIVWPRRAATDDDDDGLDAVLAAEAAALDRSSTSSVTARSQREVMVQMTESLKLLAGVVQVHLSAASTCKQGFAALGGAARQTEAGVSEFADTVNSHLDDVREKLSSERKSLSRAQGLVAECQGLLGDVGEDLDGNKNLKRAANVVGPAAATSQPSPTESG